ncbi:regulatory protein RecX [Benzoatithermus flavus]|uniref:Regulatory protein RecX n=1 Tax=Benzoatithermus flavus TaxID=3108223 RepID=A0ABU8XPP1_9PROT
MRKAPVAPTPERLHARALRYLERFATTSAHLRRVLLRRALRDAELLELDPVAVRRDVEAVVARVTAAGLIDDRLFAASRARRLAETGRSPARIRLALLEKGLDAEAVAAAMSELAEEKGDPELAAAIAYARKRRLGPWRPAEEREAHAARDLAALARAGFAYRVARRIMEASDPAELKEAS